MLVHIPKLLSSGEVAKLREQLADADFASGTASAGGLAARVKHNEELVPSVARKKLAQRVAQAVVQHPLIQRHALPHRTSHPIFVRYQPEMAYGWHTDDAVMGAGGYRSDLALTVFLSSPDEYEGGALVIETASGQCRVRHPAGDAVLYSASRLHQVEPVVKGERWVAVLWIQSQVRDDQQREVLGEIDALRDRQMESGRDLAECLKLDWLYSRLLRMWAEV